MALAENGRKARMELVWAGERSFEQGTCRTFKTDGKALQLTSGKREVALS